MSSELEVEVQSTYACARSCSLFNFPESFLSKAKFHNFSATLLSHLASFPKSSPLELFAPICCITGGVKAQRNHCPSPPFPLCPCPCHPSSANSSVNMSTNPTFLDSYHAIRSPARAWGNTRLCEQQPNLGIPFTPAVRGSMETRPAAKKRRM